jgi:4-amino-4-deoxy-L-arabinose transferase-like glycosyltransferase
MATEYARPTDTRAHTPIRPRAGRGTLPRIAGMAVAWRHAALGAVLLVAAALNLWGLDREGYANTYDAAAVKSMLTSWHNFFYVAYDSGGFVAVDKPPLGLWIQAASAKLFGFSGLSLLVPEALAGVLAVAVLYRLVARPFGSVAGLVAALALALTPVAVVTNRNNTIDSLLILTLLLGAWAASRAAATGRPARSGVTSSSTLCLLSSAPTRRLLIMVVSSSCFYAPLDAMSSVRAGTMPGALMWTVRP